MWEIAIPILTFVGGLILGGVGASYFLRRQLTKMQMDEKQLQQMARAMGMNLNQKQLKQMNRMMQNMQKSGKLKFPKK
ncbi:hypothetical protein BSNK01_31590 [Bacillaceae bacterium]